MLNQKLIKSWIANNIPLSLVSYSNVRQGRKALQDVQQLKQQVSQLRETVSVLKKTVQQAEVGDIKAYPIKQVYERYFELSSDMELAETIELQSSVAKKLWDTGGTQGGEVHKKTHSHWSESAGFAEKFEAWGNKCRTVLEDHPEFDKTRQDLRVSEYGSGGGAVLKALDRYASQLHGFDIAQTNLDECERVLGEKFSGHLVSNDLKNLLEVDIELDVFLSFNVFQHFPSRAYAASVLNNMHRMLVSGGILIVDIRIDNGDPRFVGYTLDDYDSLAGHTFANCMRIDLFSTLLERTGFRVDKIGMIRQSNNMATFWATKL